MRYKTGDNQEIKWAVAYYLIGNADIATLGVLGFRLNSHNYTARGHKLRFRDGFQRMALQSGKADRRRKIRFSVYPIRWKKKRGLCPWAVYVRLWGGTGAPLNA